MLMLMRMLRFCCSRPTLQPTTQHSRTIHQPCLNHIHVHGRRTMSTDGRDLHHDHAQRDPQTGAYIRTEEQRHVAAWAEHFTRDSIPAKLFHVRTIRSGGPGGQHVNRTESKVELRFPLDVVAERPADPAAAWLPLYVRKRLREMYPHHIVGGSESERHGANKNNHLSFNITSQTSRDQAKNHAECIDKIHACIRAVIDALPGETDARRHQHVERLRKIGNERRLEEKKRMAARKGMRRAGMSRKDL